MTIEERLNEIVEKGQGDAIIPFLQGLTQEERKRLFPALTNWKNTTINSCNLTRTHTVHAELPNSIVSSILPLSSSIR